MKVSVGIAYCAMVMTTWVGLTGCNQQPVHDSHAPATGAAASSAPEHEHSAPDGGHLIDLGNGKYHAELVHDDATRKVGVYLFDETAANAAAIDAEAITVNCLVDGKPAQFSLAAMPQSNDDTGSSSYFELADEKLCDAWDAHGAATRISVLVAGRPYTGDIAAHDHAGGHTHSHAGDDALVWCVELDVQGYHLALGHHGESLHAGHEVEPAVQITANGQPVADAKVFNSLLSSDMSAVLAPEVATVYEPPTSEEPAHYAQGGLAIPAGTQAAVVRYRVVLPNGEEQSFDVPVEVD